ncbi:hypothetical protein ACI2KH_20020 [Roseomonas mucosa]|uniref:hypothetical protein n=1 Tax=Roseomonas mucosa TaxID=207340 RepID=UPI00384E5AFB
MNKAQALLVGRKRQVDVRDYGPAIRMRRKASQPENPRDVAKEFGPDPADPQTQVRRARRVVQYAMMHERGTITDQQREACDRYLVEVEAVHGAKDRPTIPCGRLPPWMQGHPSERQVRATVSLRAACAAIGNNGRALMDLLVIENLSVSLIAERRKEDRKATLGQVQATLTRLAEHWRMM